MNVGDITLGIEGHYITSKPRQPITYPHAIMSKNSGTLSLTIIKTGRLLTQ